MWQLGPEADRPEWQLVEDVPIDSTIYDVAQTVEGPYAIGDGGTLIANRDGDEDWDIIFDDGPATRDNRLTSLAVTDDGQRLWFCGSSGALGCYDVKERRKYDYSYPREMTSTWEGLTAAGPAGSEKILIANGSGEVLPVSIDGFDVDWGVVSKPGSGATIAALASTSDGYGYAIDQSGNAYKTTRTEGWEDIGIVNAQVKFHDIYAGPNGRVYVAAGDGRLYRYDDSYHSWTPIGVANETLRAVDLLKGQLVVVGSGGTVYQRQMGGQRWEKVHTPTSATIYDLALGYPDIAVGKSGTIMTRPTKKAKEDQDLYEGRGELWDGPDDDPEKQEPNDGSSSDSTSDSTDDTKNDEQTSS